MNKTIIAVALAILFPLQVFAAQLQLQTRANTTSPSVDTNFTRQQLMNTEVYTTKADKDKVVRYWADHPDGTTLASGTLVAFGGKLYNTTQNFLKTAGATPDAFTEYFEVASGGVTDYTLLTNKPPLGTAAALDVGTEPGNVMRLDSSGRVPAFNGSQLTGISGTIPSGSTTGQTIEWDAANSTWSPVDWNTISADGTTVGITGGVLSVKSGVFESSDAAIVKVYEIDTPEKFASVLGWAPEAGTLTPTVQSTNPTSASPAGLYGATGSGHVFLQTPSHLFDISAGTATANYRTLTLAPPDHGTISVTDTDLTPNTLTCGTGGSTCSGTSLNGVTISPFTGTADSGYVFNGWGGEASGSTYNTGSVVMDGDKSASAIFTASVASTTLVSQLLEDQTIDLALYSVGQSFTLTEETPTDTMTVAFYMPTIGTTCGARLGTANDLYEQANVINAQSFVPVVGRNEIQFNLGSVKPAGTYVAAILCDTGSVSRKGTNVYAGGAYRYGASKTWNIASEVTDKDLKFEVVTP